MAPRKNNKQIKRRKTSEPNRVETDVDPSEIISISEHPLLNPLILETVLIFCKSGYQNDTTFFPTLQLVSKLWNIEVCKILRPQTQIPLHRLLSPYPEGLGWKWNRSHKTIGYQYQSPYPETPEFPNVKITVTKCRVTKDPKVIRWSKVMGGQIKSLHYSSPLNCYHQNGFLGDCLQTWCPNLENLHLSEVQCFASLLYIFEGDEQEYRKFEKKGLNCKNLRSLTISVDSDNPTGEFTQCNHKTNYCLLSTRRFDIATVLMGMEEFTKLINNLPERNLETGELFYQLIDKKTEELPKNYFEEIIVPKYFGPEDYFKHRAIDWGALGLILRDAPLKKIKIKKLNGEQQCRALTLFLLCQPSKLRSTLELVEFQNNVFVGRDPTCLKILSVWKCPLKFIRLDNLFPVRDLMDYFYDWLNGCSDTLTCLEVGAAEFMVRRGGAPPVFKVPVLPKLKKIKNRNLSMLPVEGSWILMNCPKLEICEFLDEGNGKDEFKRRAMDLFCNELEESCELGGNLKEVKFCGGMMNFENVVQLGKGLGNLRKVDLGVDGADELECLLEWMGIKWGKMEEFKVVVGGLDDERDERWNEMFSKHLDKIKNLKFLELEFQEDKVNLSLEALRNGFAKLEGLTSLKINNFGVFSGDKEEIEKSVEHIPFVNLSGMRFNSQPKWLETARQAISFFLNW